MVEDTPESPHQVEYACFPRASKFIRSPSILGLKSGREQARVLRNGNTSDQRWTGRDSLAAAVMNAPRKGAGSIEALTGQSDQSGRYDPEREHAFLALPLVPNSDEARPLEIVSHGRAVGGGKSRLGDLRDDGVD